MADQESPGGLEKRGSVLRLIHVHAFPDPSNESQSRYTLAVILHYIAAISALSTPMKVSKALIDPKW